MSLCHGMTRRGTNLWHPLVIKMSFWKWNWSLKRWVFVNRREFRQFGWCRKHTMCYSIVWRCTYACWEFIDLAMFCKYVAEWRAFGIAHEDENPNGTPSSLLAFGVAKWWLKIIDRNPIISVIHIIHQLELLSNQMRWIFVCFCSYWAFSPSESYIFWDGPLVLGA